MCCSDGIRRRAVSPARTTSWNGWDDPLFTSALDVVKETLHSQTQFDWDLKPLFRLQMAYLLLWSGYRAIRFAPATTSGIR